MNTTSMIAEPITVKHAPAMDIPRRLLWRMGFDAFCEKRSYFDMLTTDERQGWRDALATCADCETANYLGSVN